LPGSDDLSEELSELSSEECLLPQVTTAFCLSEQLMTGMAFCCLPLPRRAPKNQSSTTSITRCGNQLLKHQLSKEGLANPLSAGIFLPCKHFENAFQVFLDLKKVVFLL
jgi:hypothetical protein